MQRNLIALAIPVFFALIAVEFAVSRWKKRPVYRLNDTFNDLSCGILQQLMAVFSGVALLGLYAWVAEHLRVLPEPMATDSAVAWVMCFLGVDLLYYWFHRFSHESAAGWMVHVVHHQSEEYNLAVALRQDAFQPFISTLFYLPLAVLGFPVVMFATCAAVNTLYQFWIHTRLVGRLGPLEWVINTPSHHRVHHGAELWCLDSNYAGVFIIWDRMFGTFTPERSEPRYGVLDPVGNWNPVSAQLQYPALLWRKVQDMPTAKDAFLAVFRAPGWFPGGDPQVFAQKKVNAFLSTTPYNADAAAAAKPYAFALFLVTTVEVTWLLFNQYTLDLPWKALVAFHLVWTLVVVGGLFDRPRWLGPAELLRAVFTVMLAGLPLTWGAAPWLWALPVVAVVLAAWWLAIRARVAGAPA